MTFRPEKFCPETFGQRDSLACVSLAGDTLARVDTFFLKSVDYFFQIFPYGSPYGFFFILWYPKGSKKNWPKCHSGQSVSGQSVTGQSVTLAKVSLAKKSPAKVTLAKLSLRPKCLWPKCPRPKGHSVQSVILAKVSRPKWSNCDSAFKRNMNTYFFLF